MIYPKDFKFRVMLPNGEAFNVTLEQDTPIPGGLVTRLPGRETNHRLMIRGCGIFLNSLPEHEPAPLDLTPELNRLTLAEKVDRIAGPSVPRFVRDEG